MWFMGTNDQPGDYRHSGCAGCHVVYANDRERRPSLTSARHGRDGQTATVDPTIAGKLRLASVPEERRVGKECVSSCRYRRASYDLTNREISSTRKCYAKLT